LTREIDTEAEDITSLARHNRIDAHTLTRAYKENLSDYRVFQEVHKEMFKEEAFVFPKNFGRHIGIDETCLFNGDFYTIILNKSANGKKGSIAAIVKGTRASSVVEAVNKHCGIAHLFDIAEITMDFSMSMDWIGRGIGPNAMKTIDRFHAEQLITEAVQAVRIEYRWAAIEKENELLSKKGDQTTYRLPMMTNGETERQLLARSRGLLFKSPDKWSKEQKQRAEVLFTAFPKIKKAHSLYMSFKSGFSMNKLQAKDHFTRWIDRAMKSGFKQMMIAAKTIKNRLSNVLNYLENKATNAASENFNAKIKSLIARVRGVRDKDLFLYRLFKLYA
jgi:transposase